MPALATTRDEDDAFSFTCASITSTRDPAAVVVLYTNYPLETALRTIVPKRIWFGSTEWHLEEGWLLDSLRCRKSEERSFAMKDIRVWSPEIRPSFPNRVLDRHRNPCEVGGAIVRCDNPNIPSLLTIRYSLAASTFGYQISSGNHHGVRRSISASRHLLELAPRRDCKRECSSSATTSSLEPDLFLAAASMKCLRAKLISGRIEAGVSLARLGLSVHCTGDFLNPGYRGHMPLQLINFSPNPIRIFPYLPICQLMLAPISSRPRKRMERPSCKANTWMTMAARPIGGVISELRNCRQSFDRQTLLFETQEFLLRRIGVEDPEIIERFEKFVERMPTANGKTQKVTILDTFSSSCPTRIVCVFGTTLSRVQATCSSESLGQPRSDRYLSGPLGWLHYSLWIATALLALPFLAALMDLPKSYFGKKELQQSTRG